MSKILLPPLWLLTGIIAIVGSGIWLPGASLLAFPWTLIGLVPMAAGIALNLIADRAFKRHQTTIKPFEVSTSLVTEGVFRFSRNPIYLGMVLILLGTALLTGAATPFAICVAFALVMQYRFILIEERMLKQRFGAEWERYAAAVRRWV